MKTANLKIKRVPQNNTGRDFVIGDLHGETLFLRLLLEHVHFDKTRDRLFSVGDLIDRGPDSEGALELIDAPWFYSVRGNHEDMLEDFLSPVHRYPSRYGHPFMMNGSEWFMSRKYSRQEQKTLYDKIQVVPDIIVIGDGDARINIVHAELVTMFEADLFRIVIDIASDADIDAEFSNNPLHYVPGYDGMGGIKETLQWGRAIKKWIQREDDREVTIRYSGHLSPTYCGHTVFRKPIVVAGHRFMDTGAYNMVHDTRLGLSITETGTDVLHTIYRNRNVVSRNFVHPDKAENKNTH